MGEIKKIKTISERFADFVEPFSERALSTYVGKLIAAHVPLLSEVYKIIAGAKEIVDEYKFEKDYKNLKINAEQNSNQVELIKRIIAENAKRIKRLEGDNQNIHDKIEYINLDDEINSNIDYMTRNKGFADSGNNRSLCMTFAQQASNYRDAKKKYKNVKVEYDNSCRETFGNEIEQEIFEQIEKSYKTKKK